MLGKGEPDVWRVGEGLRKEAGEYWVWRGLVDLKESSGRKEEGGCSELKGTVSKRVRAGAAQAGPCSLCSFALLLQPLAGMTSASCAHPPPHYPKMIFPKQKHIPCLPAPAPH